MKVSFNMGKCVGAVSVLAALLFSSGCATTTTITADTMRRMENPTPKNLTVFSEAKDGRRNKSDQVGRQTFTVFAIPTFGVFSEDQVEMIAGALFVEALKQSGYEVNIIEKLGEAKGPVLAVQVDSMHNYLYSWFYPLGITVGRAQMTPMLLDKEGKTLWKGYPCAGWGGCPSLLYMCGFDTSINSEMTTILTKIMYQLNNQEFIQAISSPQPK